MNDTIDVDGQDESKGQSGRGQPPSCGQPRLDISRRADCKQVGLPSYLQAERLPAVERARCDILASNVSWPSTR